MTDQSVNSTSDARTVNNTMRHQYRVLSDEEKATITRARLNPEPRRPEPLDERVKAIADRLGDTWPVRAGMTALNALALPGDAKAGRFTTEPETSGQWSEEDEARAAANQGKMADRAFDLAGLITGGAYASPAVENSVGMGVTRQLGPQGRPAWCGGHLPRAGRRPRSMEAMDAEMAGASSSRGGVQAFLNRRDALRSSLEVRMSPEQLTAFREAYPEGSMNFPGPAEIEKQFGKLQTPVAVSKSAGKRPGPRRSTMPCRSWPTPDRCGARRRWAN